MTENTNNEITAEQRQAVRDKYATSPVGAKAVNPSLSALKRLAYAGIILGIVLAFIAGAASGGAFGPLFVIASFLISIGVIAMFSNLIASAIITGLKK